MRFVPQIFMRFGLWYGIRRRIILQELLAFAIAVLSRFLLQDKMAFIVAHYFSHMTKIILVISRWKFPGILV